jgi:uncharacterized protein YyaL (SSP411 family)
MPNSLAGEKSPYLLQHADNPVDWQPWGEAAFARARAEQKPIFLSIGYSTCHWCHVMAHESFENADVADLLNADFVAIKVDREERPDVDRIYMSYVQALTGHGGWPLSAWLTPELKPIYGGTYFPPDDRHGRPGFASLLRAIAANWRDDRPRLTAEADRVLAALRNQSRAGGGPAEGSAAPADEDRALCAQLATGASEAFEKCFETLAQAFDAERGGFGTAPKFPRAGNLDFLFRCAALQGVESESGGDAVRMTSRTLQQMARGGIHDHVGGGFHRYAVDADWFVPHFEKMLYDQALITFNALEAWQATGDERHAWLARDILDYALRDLGSPAGGFCSAEDADSASEYDGKHCEGAFYVWSEPEIREALGADAALFCSHYGVKPDGNVPPASDPHGEFTGKNILAQQRPLVETAQQFALDPERASDRLVACLEKLRTVRATRPRPQLDDKILTAWNGLMISALARAAVLPAESLDDRRDVYLTAAVRAAGFVREELFDAQRGVLFRSWREGRGSAEGFAEDYAYLIQGLLDLYEATFDAGLVRWAEELQAKMDALFWDADRGGYFNSAAGAPDVILRLKEDYDGAEPAPSSVAASNLLRLEGIAPMPGTGGPSHRIRALRTLSAFQPRWQDNPQALPHMLCAVERALELPRHLALAGDPGSGDFQALAAVARARLSPRRTLLALDGGAGQAWLASRSPWLAAMKPLDGKATAYLCENFTCQAPVTSPDALQKLL